ncbi:hypothetical protein D3C76_1117630 [compost metagenome]
MLVEGIHCDHRPARLLGGLQLLAFLLLKDTRLHSGIDRALPRRWLHHALLERLGQTFVQGGGVVQRIACTLQRSHRITVGLGPEAAGQQLLQGRVALAAPQQLGHFGIQFVARPGVAAPKREYQHTQGAADEAVGEVVEQTIQGTFRLAQAFLHGPTQQRLHVLWRAQVVVALECSR